jgi:hypothetical protein
MAAALVPLLWKMRWPAPVGGSFTAITGGLLTFRVNTSTALDSANACRPEFLTMLKHL